MIELSMQDLLEAFHEMGQRAKADGKVIDISVYGGSCLMIASNFRVSTRDVDAVAVSDQIYLQALAAHIALERDWPADWLNDGVRTYLSPNVEGFEQHQLYGSYPDEIDPALRVFCFIPGLFVGDEAHGSSRGQLGEQIRFG